MPCRIPKPARKPKILSVIVRIYTWVTATMKNYEKRIYRPRQNKCAEEVCDPNF